MSSNNDQTIISLSAFIYQAFKVRKQRDAPADRQNSLNSLIQNYQAIPGNDQIASPTNQNTAGSKLERTS